MKRPVDVVTRAQTFIDDVRGSDVAVNARLRSQAQGVPAGNFSFRGVIRANTSDLHITAVYDDAPASRAVVIYCIYAVGISERHTNLREALIRAQELASDGIDAVLMRLFGEGRPTTPDRETRNPR